MRKILSFAVLASLMVCVKPQVSEAQYSSQRPSGGLSFSPDRPPSTEIGFHVGVWALEDGAGDLGLHVTRNRSEWFGIEYGLGFRPGQRVRPTSAVGLVNARLSLSHPDSPALAFITLGLGAGNSENWAVSPMGGFGVQFTPRRRYGGQDSSLMLRAELQYFALGQRLKDRGRLLISFVGSFGGRW